MSPEGPTRVTARHLPARSSTRARSAEAKEQVREALIEAGRVLFARDGEIISLRMIARHAHYSPGIVYRYFPDRESLFLAIRDSELSRYVARLEAELGRVEGSAARLRLIAYRGMDYAAQQAQRFGLNSLAIRWIYRDPAIAGASAQDRSPAAARIHAIYEAAILAVMQAGGKAPDAAALDIAVASFMAVITGATLLPEGSPYRAFPERRIVLDALVETLLREWGLVI